MTAILGISAFYHDSAAALVIDGEIVAAAQEERFTRKKHDPDFPTNAVRYCLEEAGIDADGLDYVGFYDKPVLKFDRLIETYLDFAPRGFRSFASAMPRWLRQKLHLRKSLDAGLGGRFRKRYIFTEHHESHAASAFFPSPFEEAAILTLDGVGEWASTTYGVGRQNRIELLGEQRFPHSLGLLYSAFTYYCGFRVNSGEYKLMGLAPYGEPKYVDRIFEKLIDLKEDGSFRLDQSFFDYCVGSRMTGKKFDRLFGRPARKPESEISQLEMDIAASVQRVTEEVMLATARHVHEKTGQRNLCLAGGVARNCVGNGRLSREGPFERIWVQPAAGDAGGALGTAMFIWHQLLEKPRDVNAVDSQRGSLLGPRFESSDIREFLEAKGAEHEVVDDEETLCEIVAEEIANGKVVGWMQGRMEFGPRALGSRSILGDPRSPAMQSVMNLKIKFRESFRPFAPSVLVDRANEFFGLGEGTDSPYMLLVAPVNESERCTDENVDSNLGELEGLDKLKAERSTIPAVTHVDYSARVQTVSPDSNPRYHRLIEAFERQTGCPLLINTSFNVRGEPIVCTPSDAYRCFMGTDMDVLVLENCILRKETQTATAAVDREAYCAEFALD